MTRIDPAKVCPMQVVTTQQVINFALREHRAGRFAAAEQIYRQILAEEPRNATALHLLGALAHQHGRQHDAIELYGRAIAIDSSVASYHSNLGISLAIVGRQDEAIDASRTSISLKPDYPEAHNN